MTEFLKAQLDFIFFIFGLALITIAAVSFAMRKLESRGLGWLWLGLFGLTAGSSQWLNLVAYTVGDYPDFVAIRVIHVALAFLFLVEFARVSTPATLFRPPDRWIYLPLIVVIAVSWFAGGWQGMLAMSRIIGLVAGLWSALVVYYRSRRMDGAIGGWFAAGGLALALYGATISTTPQVIVYPQSLLDSMPIFEILGFTIGLMLCVFAIFFSAAIWSYYVNVSAAESSGIGEGQNKLVTRIHMVAALAIVVLMASGWLITDIVGKHGESELKKSLLARTRSAAAAMDGSTVAALKGTSEDVNAADYGQIRNWLLGIREANQDSRFVYLMGLRAGRVVFLADAEPINSKDYSAPGDAYEEATPELIALFSNGKPYIEGPLKDSWGIWVSGLAPIVDPATRKTVAVIGIDIDAVWWMSEVHSYRLFAIVINLTLALLTMTFAVAWQRTRESAAQAAALEVASVKIANEEKLRDITSALGEGVIVNDRDGMITFANPEGERLLGWERGEIIGKNMFTAVPCFTPQGTHVGEDDCPIIGVLRTGEARRTDDWRFGRKNGAHLLVSLTATPIVENDEVVGCVTAFQDISERKSAEEELRFRSLLLDSAIDSVVVNDFEGRILYANDAATKLSGYSKEELLKMNVRQFRGETKGEPLAKNETARFEFKLKRKNGSLVPVEMHTKVVGLDGRQVVAGVARDITERKKAEGTIRHMAYFDLLTNLPNRTLFNDRLTMALAHANRSGEGLAVLCADLDRLKIINDTLGHVAGDEILRGVAERLRKCVREGDTVARLHGDEFAILLQGVDHGEDAAKVAGKILESLKVPFDVNDQELHASLSIGIGVYPDDGTDVEALLKNAEAAMYRAKERSWGGYELYTAAMNATAFERLALENKLRHALEQEEFVLYYQPQVSLKTGKIVGVEALIRWMHPEMGLVLPRRFIDIAEDTGLIIPIGEWVLRMACAQVNAWHDAGLPKIKVSVNLSARQFEQPELAMLVSRTIGETGLDPRYLELELTESVAMQNTAATIKTLHDLGDMGINIAIDDFGTGHSSLSYLKRFPINTLKIAQPLVRDAGSNADSAAIAKAIIALGKSLKLNVIAEGVETQEELDFMKDNKCDEIQGNLFSTPIPADEMAKMLLADERGGRSAKVGDAPLPK